MIATLFLLAGATSAVDCQNPLAQFDMNRCAALDYGEADKALNAQWSRSMAYMKAKDARGTTPQDGRPTYSAALLESQRAWLRYRDAQCQSEGFTMRGGSAEPMTISGCKTQLTKARIQQLKDLEQDY